MSLGGVDRVREPSATPAQFPLLTRMPTPETIPIFMAAALGDQLTRGLGRLAIAQKLAPARAPASPRGLEAALALGRDVPNYSPVPII